MTDIFDTKGEPKFDALIGKHGKEVQDVAAAMKIKKNEHDIDFVIIRPDVEKLSDPEYLDGLLLESYYGLTGCTIYVDELYMFHRGVSSGPGLTALLTRGRSKGITFIGSTQRPARISVFAMSEAQKFFVFRLIYPDDRKKLGGIIPDFEKMPTPPKFGFIYYETGESAALRYGPVRLDRQIVAGYTDEAATNDRVDAKKRHKPAFI
jgi:hypothetical protein